MDGSGQPEEELPLAHAVDSHPSVQPKDYGTAQHRQGPKPGKDKHEEWKPGQENLAR